MRNISDLKKLSNNPRIIKDKQFTTLVKSIEKNVEYFKARPLILSDRTGEFIIIAGNQRYEAAKLLNMKQVPTYLLSGLSEEQEKEITIRDNISNGEWDWSELANEWDTKELEEWGLDVPKIDTDGAIDLNGDGDGDKKEQIETCPKCGFQWVK